MDMPSVKSGQQLLAPVFDREYGIYSCTPSDDDDDEG